MSMKIKKWCLLFVCVIFVLAANADDIKVYKDASYDPMIKTVRLQMNGLTFSEPIIGLNGGDGLALTFDDLSDDSRSFSYSIQLCNFDWTANTELSAFDYVQGFQDNQIVDYQKSFNTIQHYIHYTVSLPNENLHFKKSGNYAVIVKESNSGKIMLTKRFMVNENQVAITGQIIRPRNLEITNTHQQLDIQIDCKGLSTSNPFDEIKMVIYQNDRWDNPITGVQPTFVQDNILKYNSDQDLVFPATKEFRKIDLSTTRIKTARVQRVNNDSQIAEIFIMPEALRSFKSYVYEKDWNGDFVIMKQEAINSDIEADYVWTHWSMPFSNRLIGGDFYVCGKFTNWDTLSTFRMKYNANNQAYEAKAFIKQGYYDYMIGYWEPENKFFDMLPAEGNWYETENQYTVMVYYHPFTGRNDQLVGVSTFHTMK